MTQYIFLIGAAKCGTTKLADMLDCHPDICLSQPKESDYFSDRVFAERSQDWYLSLFDDDANEPGKAEGYRLDASTCYTAGWRDSSAPTAKRIAEFAPSAQIVYLARNPVARSWSSYWHSVRTGSEKRNAREALSDNSSQHIQASLYHRRLTEYCQYFPREQINVIYFEEFVKNPEAMVNTLLAQIGLSAIDFSSVATPESVNSSYQWSGPFSFLGNIQSHRLQRVNAFVKKLVPKRLHQAIKNIASKPIPVIPTEMESLVDGQTRTDFELFGREFGQKRIQAATAENNS